MNDLLQEYERAWCEFLDGKPTIDQVLDKARQLGEKYGFDVNW